MAVRIRMKRMGRKHRPFFRICAVDSRNPRDGKVLEELGTYDPMIDDTDARVVLKTDRLGYWLGVGAQPSDKVKVFIKKYGANGERLSEQEAARQRLSLPKQVPPAPEPVYVPPPKGQVPTTPEPAVAAPEAAAVEAPAAETPAAEGGAEPTS